MRGIFRVQKIVLQPILALAMIMPVMAWGQHREEGHASEPKRESAPRSAPAQHSAPHSTPRTASPSYGAERHSSSPNRASENGRLQGSERPSASARASSGNANRGPATRATNPRASRSPNANRPASPSSSRTAAFNRPSAGNRTPPGRTVTLRGGGTASVRPNGQIRSINRGGMHIQNNIQGSRTVVTERNGARIVSRPGGGYVQRSYITRGNTTFVSRTYVSGGVVRVGVYRSYYFGGHPYYGYYPGVWYHPGFYGWGYRPWGFNLYWGVGAWGWGGSPWWGFYGGWFTPYPYYASPAFWLTDYLIANSLQTAYQDRQLDRAAEMDADAQTSAGSNGGGGNYDQQGSSGVTLSPEVKQAIAEEVKAQLEAQQAQVQNGQAQNGSDAAAPGSAPAAGGPNAQAVPPALDPAQRTFVVDSDITVVANGQECGLTAGDVVTRLTDTPDADNNVSASVAASKKGECAAGQTVAVKVDDLQEMYNHFQENLQNGMSELAKKQGTNGMPKAPDVATTPSDVPTPQPDADAAKTLQEQEQQADQAVQEAKQESATTGGSGAAQPQ